MRVLLQSGSEVVGEAGLAIGAEYDPATRCVKLVAGAEPAGVGLLLRREDVSSFRIVVLD